MLAIRSNREVAIRSIAYANGAALVETIALSAGLLLFMTGIPMVGSLIDLNQTTMQASRYLAWEKTVQPNSVLVTDQVESRFFQDHSAPIQTQKPIDELLGTNLLWGPLVRNTTPNGTAESGSLPVSLTQNRIPLHQRARVTADVKNVVSYIADETLPTSAQFSNGKPGTTISNPEKSRVFDRVGRVVGGLGRFLSKDGWDNANPYVNGLMRSQVEVKVENNQLLKFAGNNCVQGGAGCVHESTSILVDGWSAANPQVLRDRVHGFVPSNRLHAVGKLISKIKVIPMLKDLKHLEGAFGCVKLGVRPSKDMRALPTYQSFEGDDC